MKKKRIAAMLLAVVLGASTILSGCGNDGSSTDKGTDSGTEDNKDNAGDDKKSEEGNDDVKVVTYGGWENPIMARELADKFNQLHDDIRVEVVLDGWSGNDKMTELAATGDMPDIINLENITVPMQNGWIIDMKPYLDKDEDAKNLPENMLNYGTVGEKVVMLPGAVYMFGVMVNKDLLASNGIEIPEYTWNIDQFKDIVKKTTKPGSMIGASEVMPLMKHLPPQMNPALGWGSFNEETKEYQLGSEYEFAVNTVKELLDAKVSLYEPLDAQGVPWDFEEGSTERQEVDEKRANFLMETVGETEAIVAWSKGKAATWLDFTWATSFTDREDYGGFDWDFYPIPLAGEGTENRVPFVLDSIAVTSTCEYPEAAYEFIKFLSFSDEGIQARIDIVENQDKEALMEKYPDRPEADFELPLNFDQMPVTTNQEMIDKWVELNNVKPGFAYQLERLSDGYADGYKVTPGFDDAYHKTVEKTVKEEVLTGQKTMADVAGELQTKANEITKEAYEIIGE